MFHDQRVVAIIQARMSASRLPGKVLKDIAGAPMLMRVVARTRRATVLDEIIVATTTDPSDDVVTDFCNARGYRVFRGDLYDVLDRYYQAACVAGAQVIVRITADCPVIDPALIDRTVRAFFGETQPQDVIISQRAARLGSLPLIGAYDFAANRLPPPWGRTYPIGLDVEVCSFAALEYAWQHAREKHEREHVMPYLYQTRDLFSNLLAHHTEDLGALRWTVDTPEDLEFIRALYARFADRDDFTWEEIRALVQREPDLANINAGIQHKSLFDVDQRAAPKPGQ